MRLLVGAIVLACGISADANAQSAQQPAAIPVSVVAAEHRAVTKTADFVGRVDAMQRVEVRARVTGYLENVLFKEGDPIKEGAPLYEIENGLFKAAVEQADGSLAKSKAAKTLAEVQLQRAQDLLDKNAGTVVARDQAQAQDESARGAVMIDEANLQTAKINLGYTQIMSPITGKVGKTNVTKGNVVSPESGALTVIVSQDPMYVAFPVSQREFLRVRETQKAIDLTGIRAQLRFSDGTTYKHPGTINFVDVIVDRATDTVLVRATFPNPDSELTDGQLVRVGLAGGEAQDRIVIPQAALISDQEGVYVFVVADGKAAVRRVKTGGANGTGVIIEQGINAGDQVVVEGFQGLRPGVAVRATPQVPALDRS